MFSIKLRLLYTAAIFGMSSSPQKLLMETAIRGLLSTRVEYPFGGTTTKCKAFFVPRPNGANVWVYSSSHVGEYTQHIEDLGGVKYQLLNHRDEASKFSNVLKAPVFCSALERNAIEAKGCKVGKTFDTKTYEDFGEAQEGKGSDLIAYHTPGHAVGVTSYLWNVNDETSVLFTGDSLYIAENGMFEHGPLMFHGYDGNVQDMIDSFELMLRLNPTYIVPGLIQGDNDFINKFQPDQVRNLIAKLKRQL